MQRYGFYEKTTIVNYNHLCNYLLVIVVRNNFSVKRKSIANHLSHKWKKPDYYLNYACAGHQDLPVEFEYTFVLGGHTLLYNYCKVASELKGNIVRE